MTLLEFWRAGFIARHVALKGLLKDTLYLVFKDRFAFNDPDLDAPESIPLPDRRLFLAPSKTRL